MWRFYFISCGSGERFYGVIAGNLAQSLKIRVIGNGNCYHIGNDNKIHSFSPVY
jgi:hypothetical protein